ncbi:MAG: ATP-binding protein [Chitinophagales bacterium]
MLESSSKHISNEKLSQSHLWEIVDSLNNSPSLLPDNMVSIVDNALIDAQQLADEELLFTLHLRFGSYLLKKQKYEKAKIHTESALQLAIQSQDNGKLTSARINLGIIATNTNKLNEGLYHLTKALENPTKELKFNIYASIAGVHTRQNKHETALEFFEKAKNEVDYKTNLQFAGLYIATGYALSMLSRYDEALKDINTAYELFKDNPAYKHETAMCLSNMAQIKFDQGKYEESVSFIKESIALYEEIQYPEFLMADFLFLAQVYLSMEQFDAAYHLMKKTLQTYSKEDFLKLYISALKRMVAITKAMHKLEECIDYQNELIEIQSEYFYPEKKEKIEALLDKKEGEIDVLISKNQKIEKQNQQLQYYNKELEQYAFIIAHDLKEPLCNISGFTSLLKKNHKQSLDSEVIDFLQYIETGAQQMHQLLEDLLQYSTLHIDATKIQAIHLPTIIQEVFEETKQNLSIQQAQISIPDELPTVYAESKHIKWLLSQLIGNALKFSHSDRISQIAIRSYEKNQKTFIEIKDNGIGIEKNHQQKVFRIFQRLNKEDFKGTGIGLSICKKIVELYDGEIGMESNIGAGTKVSFRLPIGV